MRRFYCDVLGCVEIPKPAPLQGRGGFWVQAGETAFHFGIDRGFHPATKAHPAFMVSDIHALACDLANAGTGVRWDTALRSVTRFFTFDPVGNRIEIIASS